jgi:DedD protein
MKFFIRQELDKDFTMEKEKRKLLMVAVTSGVFFVIVISAAILIFTPRISANRDAVFSQSKPEAADGGWIETAHNPVVLATLDAAKNTEETGETPMFSTLDGVDTVHETSFIIKNENSSVNDRLEKNGAANPAKTIISIPKPSTAAVPDVPVEVAPPAPRTASVTASAGKENARIGAAAKPAAVKPAAAKPAVQKPAVAKPAAQKSAAKPAAAKPAVAKPAVLNDYWVQTGAFTAKVHADGAKETLDAKGITSIIENREVDGKTWYRVRVGPYTSENEAKYWLALVQSIDGFAGSQVRQSPRAR